MIILFSFEGHCAGCNIRVMPNWYQTQTIPLEASVTFEAAEKETKVTMVVSTFKKIVNMIKAQTGCPKERELLLAAI